MARSFLNSCPGSESPTAYPARGARRERLEFARVEPRRPSESASILTRWMGVMDANTAGNVHGGVILRICDEAAGLAAVRHSRGRVVTAGKGRETLLLPAFNRKTLNVPAPGNPPRRTAGGRRP